MLSSGADYVYGNLECDHSVQRKRQFNLEFDINLSILLSVTFLACIAGGIVGIWSKVLATQQAISFW